VIEDIELNQKILERMLVVDHHIVTIAATGTEAIMLLKNKKFDLVFLDMLLPDMHGLTLLKYINNADLKVKGVKDKTKIIAITASITTEQIKAYEDSGIIQVIQKPIMQEELKQAINQLFFNKTEQAINESNQIKPSVSIHEKQCGKLLFNAKVLIFLKENLSSDEFLKVVLEVPVSIDKQLNKVISARENNNDVLFVEELHRLAGFSAQIGLEQLCEAAIKLQKSNTNNQKKNLTHLLKLAKSSVSTFKEENV
jgi:CheY-like chemotaxis protein